MTIPESPHGRRARAKWLIAAVFALLAVFAAAGCGGDDESGENGANGGQAGGEELTIAYSLPLGQEPQLQAIARGEEEAIEQLGLNWKVDVADAELSPDKQVADIDTFISQGDDALTSWTLDPGAADAAYRRASEAGLPVIGFNSESEFFDSSVQTETDGNGCIVSEQQVEYLTDRAPKARVLVLGGPPVPSVSMFTDCFVEKAEQAGLEIVDRGDDVETSGASGRKLAEDLLTENPDVDAVWTYGDTTAIGASSALRSAGKGIWTEEDQEGVLLISRNGAPEAAGAIRSGQLTASWDSNQVRSGAAAIQLLKMHLVDGVRLEDLPERVEIPSTRWDGTNIGDYLGPLDREVELLDIPAPAKSSE